MIGDIIERATRERLLQDERQLIKDYQAAGYVEAKGVVVVMDEIRLRTEFPLAEVKTEVLIVNATTAAALRKQLGENAEHIEMIITAAADTGTVYQVTNDNLRKQLLRSIRRSGAAGRRKAQ